MGAAERVEGEGNGRGGKEAEGEEKGLLDGVGSVLDFDMLCATVAMQTQGFSVEKRGKGGMVVVEMEEETAAGEVGGVQRMWEGGVLDCFQDHRIAIETTCLPCYRFGKNMGRANLGSCFLQGAMYFFFTVTILLNTIAFSISMRRRYLYLAAAFIISAAIYLGYFRGRIRRQFNIKGSNSALDDCVNHLLCPCCTLCQESRTLEMNNVQDGVWRGRGDTICIGSFGEGNKAFIELCPPSLIQPNLLSYATWREQQMTFNTPGMQMQAIPHLWSQWHNNLRWHCDLMI